MAYLVVDVLSFDFERRSVGEPVVWNLNLESVNNVLFEDTVIVPESVTPSWEVKSGHGVQEASGESSQTTISKTGVFLIIDHLVKTETELIELGSEVLFDAEIEKGVLESSSEQVLDTEVVNSLRVLAGDSALSLVPKLDKSILDNGTDGVEPVNRQQLIDGLS